VAQDSDIAIRLESNELTGDELEIRRIDGVDRISQLFEYSIRVQKVADADLDPAELLLEPASLSFEVDGEEIHRLFGMISRVRDVASSVMGLPRYELTFVPRAFGATMHTTLDIFMEVSVPDIIDQCLTRCGLEAGEHYDLGGLTEEYGEREYVVQYKESDFSFISRLCEHEGIWFYVDHSQGKDVLIFGDSNAGFPSYARAPEIPFIAVETGSGRFGDRIGSVDVIATPLPQRYTVRDYNWRIPGVDLMASADVDADGLGEIVEYGAHFKGPNDGQRIADVRAQELIATKRVWECLGATPGICAGHTFMLTGHPNGDSELLVTEVRHVFAGQADDASPTELTTSVKAIPSAVTFRPRRLTHKPQVSGVLTGMIDAGVRDDYADIDDQGRYRVRFMFDTAERGEGQASRLVRMAQPHSGTGFGMHFPLRPNTEVILTCVDGDPDRPIITGTVPNPENSSPVTAGNRDRNVIRTGGGNEIDISDEDGVQRIKMTTPHMGTVFQLGAPNAEEEGGIIQTSGNMVGQVADTYAAGSETWSAIQDLKGDVTGSNTTSIAGIPNPVNGFENFMKFYKSAKKTVEGLDKLADTTLKEFDGKKSDEEGRKAANKRDKKAAEDAIINRRQPEPKYPDDAKTTTYTYSDGTSFETRETEAQFRARIQREELARMREAGNEDQADQMQAEVDAADNRGDLAGSYWQDDYANFKKPWTKDVAAVLDAGEKVADAVAKPLFSKIHKDAQKRIDSCVWAAAKAWAGFGTQAAAASKPRNRHVVRMPGTYYHLLVATDSAILNGYQGAYVMGKTAGVVGRSRAVVASKSNLHLDGGSNAEMAATTVKITSDRKFDVFSRDKIKMKSKGDTEIRVDKKMKVVSKDDMNIESKKKYWLKAKDLIDGKAKDIKWKAKEKGFYAYTKQDFKVTSKRHFKVTADTDLVVHGKSKGQLKSDKGGILASASQTRVDYNKSTKLELKSATAKLKSTKVEVNGSGGVTVKGSKIDVKGKVFLG